MLILVMPLTKSVISESLRLLQRDNNSKSCRSRYNTDSKIQENGIKFFVLIKLPMWYLSYCWSTILIIN